MRIARAWRGHVMVAAIVAVILFAGNWVPLPGLDPSAVADCHQLERYRLGAMFPLRPCLHSDEVMSTGLLANLLMVGALLVWTAWVSGRSFTRSFQKRKDVGA